MALVGKTFHVSCWLMKYCALLWEIRLFVSLSIFWEFSGEMNVFLSNCRLPPVKHTLPILFITRHSLKNANESLGNKWIWTFHNLDSALCSFPTAFLAPDSNGWFFFVSFFSVLFGAHLISAHFSTLFLHFSAVFQRLPENHQLLLSSLPSYCRPLYSHFSFFAL